MLQDLQLVGHAEVSRTFGSNKVTGSSLALLPTRFLFVTLGIPHDKVLPLGEHIHRKPRTVEITHRKLSGVPCSSRNDGLASDSSQNQTWYSEGARSGLCGGWGRTSHPIFSIFFRGQTSGVRKSVTMQQDDLSSGTFIAQCATKLA